MSEPPPSHGLSLPYLIDALAQLEEAITCRAGELGDAEQQLACEARGEGKPADYYADTPSRWPREREEWTRAIGPLRELATDVLETELARPAGRRLRADELPSPTGLLRVLVAARRRAGGTVDVDMLSGP